MSATFNVVCPHCTATNRLPAGKPAQRARCGACRGALFDGHPAAVGARQFDKHRRASDIPLLVDVWAPWCGPCRTMAPNFERAAQVLEPGVRLLKINVDEEQKVGAELGISSIPALLLFRGGQIVARTAGAMDAGRIVAWAQQHLKDAA
jgi:thioredoxin 2